ncbi:MAG: helix-turn-helix domain-containing protein [Burkholderiales bacterium]|nr:helix-turn-helix domain-containing protein [Burkholderiales bacterium]
MQPNATKKDGVQSVLWQRLKVARKRAGLTQQEVADACNVSRSAVSQWEIEGDKKPTVDNLRAFARATRTPLEWLMDDNASLKVDWSAQEGGADSAALIPAGVVTAVPYEHRSELPDDEFVFLDNFDVAASAGYGSNVEWVVREKNQLPFRANFLRARGLKPEACKLMTVRGDSMRPELRDGDTIIVDTSRTRVEDGEIYVVWFDGQLYVKHLIRTADTIVLHSANPLYPDVIVPRDRFEQLHVLGWKAWRAG